MCIYMVQLPTHVHIPDRRTGPLGPSDTPPMIDRRADDPIAVAAKSTMAIYRSSYGRGTRSTFQFWLRAVKLARGTVGATMEKRLTRAAKIFNLASARACSIHLPFRTVYQIHITPKWAVQSAVVVPSNANHFRVTVSLLSHHLMRS